MSTLHYNCIEQHFLQTWGSHVINWQKLVSKFKYLFCYSKNSILYHTNRMRNIHLHIWSEYGIENVRLFQQWKKLECQMADFQNHRRFLLRCPSVDIIPVSIRLKSNIRTPKGWNIINRAERALLNERIRLINDTITMFEIQRDTCKNQLSSILDKENMEEWVKFINCIRESRHIKTLERQRLKFNWLCHRNTGGHSNIHHGKHGDHNH